MIGWIREKLRLMGAEAVRYIVIGVLTTLVNFGIYTLMTKGFGMEATETGVTISNVTGISVSIIFAYIANKLFVFRSRCDSIGALAAEAGKFIGARLITFFIEVLGVELFVNRLGADAVIGKLAIQAIVIAGNYFISKFLVFRKK